MYKCEICQKEFKNKSGMASHHIHCLSKKQAYEYGRGKFYCSYGCGEKALFLLKSGKWCCSEFSTQCSCLRRKNSDSLKKIYDSGGARKGGARKGSFVKGEKSWNSGKTYEELYGEDRARKIKSSISGKNAGKISFDKLSDVEKELFRQKARENINCRYRMGWMPKSGRCKKINYNSSIAGEVKLDGFWELIVAVFMDINGVQWERNTKKFAYINLTGKTSNYTPDFFLNKDGSYVEIKGYEDELTKCKLSQFKFKIVVWKLSKIKDIESSIGITVRDLRVHFSSCEKIEFDQVIKLISEKVISR